MEALSDFDDSMLDEEPMAIDTAPAINLKAALLEICTSLTVADAPAKPNEEIDKLHNNESSKEPNKQPNEEFIQKPTPAVTNPEQLPVVPATTTKITAIDNSVSNENPRANHKAIPKQCTFCKGKHSIRTCFKFWKMPHEKCLRHILMFSYCSRCLYRYHAAKDCKSKSKCRHCQGEHHSLLHFPKANNNKPSKPKVSTSVVVSGPSTSVCHLPLRHMVTFSPTVQVKLIYDQKVIQVRAVIDLCCSHSYVSIQLARQLNISSQINSYCRFLICSIYDQQDCIALTAKVDKIKGVKTPLENVSPLIADHFKGFHLADPTFYNSGQVALVLGPELSGQIFKGNIYSTPGYPLAQYTIFGWVISGPSPF